MTLQKEMKPHDHKAPPENLWREVETTANTHCSHPERAYFLCIALILGPVPGAGVRQKVRGECCSQEARTLREGQNQAHRVESKRAAPQVPGLL